MSDLEDLYELSPMQQGLLFHALAARRPGVYQITLAYVLEGRLDTALFEQAWRRVLARHAALRTSFHWEEMEKPLQAVHREVAFELAVLDWQDVPEDALEARLTRYLDEDQRRDFDLRQAPLLRVAVVRRSATRQRLLWTFHHAILEGWSAAIVIGEVFAQYHALVAGAPLEWPAARPYRDHILWLQAQDASAAEAYWRRSLAGFHEPTPVPLRAAGAGAERGRAAQKRPVAAPTPIAVSAIAATRIAQ